MHEKSSDESMLARLLENPHFQTIWPNFFRSRPKLDLLQERIILPDGDFMDLGLLNSHTQENNLEHKSGIVFIFHGLGGSIESHYALGLMQALALNDLQPVFVHYRGASGEPNKKPISYHAGKADDIAFVIHQIQQQNPSKKLFAVGISIGGSALLNYLGREQIFNPLTATVAVSAPYELHDAAVTLNKGFAKLYQQHLLRCQKSSLRKKFAAMPCPIDLKRALNANNFYEFDDAATAPLHGFESAMDYYTQCSAKQYLKNIETPTLLIHARDDPFMSARSIPAKDELGKACRLELHNVGGHMGFVKGTWPWRMEYYLDRRIPEFFGAFV